MFKNKVKFVAILSLIFAAFTANAKLIKIINNSNSIVSFGYAKVAAIPTYCYLGDNTDEIKNIKPHTQALLKMAFGVRAECDVVGASISNMFLFYTSKGGIGDNIVIDYYANNDASHGAKKDYTAFPFVYDLIDVSNSIKDFNVVTDSLNTVTITDKT